MNLIDIPGNSCAKRATEIAKQGGLSIKFVGDLSIGNMFGKYCQANGIEAFVVGPCPCGNFGDDKRPCHCKPEEIKKYRKGIKKIKADIVVEKSAYN